MTFYGNSPVSKMYFRCLLFETLLLVATPSIFAQRVPLVFRDTNAVIYMNQTIDKGQTNWIFSLYSKSWAHVRRSYGEFRNGEGGRLTGVFQSTSSPNGMAAGVFPKRAEIYMDISPQSVALGNLYDKPGSENQRPNQDLLFDFQLGAIAQIIAEGNNNMEGCPAFGVWGIKGWSQIAVYDIFNSIGYTREAEKWRSSKSNEAVESATAKPLVYWLRDWWLPIYGTYGKTALLGRFFQLVAQYWPKEAGNRNKYEGRMNVGEFVHFFSGAARTNLQRQAREAFGWENEDEESFNKAKQDYPQIRY